MAIIAGHDNVDCNVLVAKRSLIDFIYFTHYPLPLENDLEVMATNLATFHKHKDIFIWNGSQGTKNHLQIPKLHTLVHYLENSYQLGILDNFSMETPEPLHIKMCKDPYEASNHHEFDQQFLMYLDVQDQLITTILQS